MSVKNLLKQTNWRSEKYLRYVRDLPCAHCGRPADHAHHLIGTGSRGGMGMKAPDWATFGMCGECHAEIHRDPSTWPQQWESVAQALGRAIDEGVLKCG